MEGRKVRVLGGLGLQCKRTLECSWMQRFLGLEERIEPIDLRLKHVS